MDRKAFLEKNGKDLLSIIDEIYEDLLFESQENEDGIFWDTVQAVTSTTDVKKAHHEGIFSGVSGIIFFLMAYHGVTQDTTVFKKMLRSAKWLFEYCLKNEAESLGLYKGRASAIYAFYRLYLYTKDKSFLEQANTLTEDCEELLENEQHLINLSEGISGYLLVLTILYQEMASDDLYDQIDTCLGIILHSTKVNSDGVFWDINPYAKKPILGFSEGNAGIAYVLNTVGHYFDNTHLVNLSNQAIEFDNNQYDSQIKNWPDFLNHKHFRKNFKRYKRKWNLLNDSFFDATGDTVGWEIGTPGIILGRQSLCENNSSHDFVTESRKKTYQYIEKTLSQVNKPIDFTISSGLSGLIYCLKTFNNEGDFQEIEAKVLTQLIRIHKSGNQFITSHIAAQEIEDYSLFTGVTGIGLYVLDFITEQNDDHNICLPGLKITCNSKAPSNIEINEYQVAGNVINNYFPLTLSRLRDEDQNTFFLQNKELKLSQLPSKFLSYVQELDTSYDQDIKGYLRFEKFKYELGLTTLNYHLKMARKTRTEYRNKLFLVSHDDQNLFKYSLVLSEDIHLYKTENTDSDFPDAYFIIENGPFGLAELRVDSGTYQVLETFKNPNKINQAFTSLQNEMRIPENDKAKAHEFFLQQVKKAIEKGLLREYKKGVLNKWLFN